MAASPAIVPCHCHPSHRISIVTSEVKTMRMAGADLSNSWTLRTPLQQEQESPGIFGQPPSPGPSMSILICPKEVEYSQVQGQEASLNLQTLKHQDSWSRTHRGHTCTHGCQLPSPTKKNQRNPNRAILCSYLPCGHFGKVPPSEKEGTPTQEEGREEKWKKETREGGKEGGRRENTETMESNF